MIPIYINRRSGWRKIIKELKSCGTFGSGIISIFGCNHRCPFCFAQKYSYPPLDKSRKTDFKPEEVATAIVAWKEEKPNACYLQITGGEPITNKSIADALVETITIADAQINGELRVIWQTNGIHIGKYGIPTSFLKLRTLSHTFVLFEISFKGTNPTEYSILSGTGITNGFYYQCNAYWNLISLEANNIAVVPRLGCGHHRKTIHFIYPDTLKSMFIRKNWDSEFEQIFDHTTSKYKKSKMLAECVNAEGDGAAHSYLHRSLPAIKRCLEKGCITSRSKSKAIDLICKNNPSLRPKIVNSENYQKDYSEFCQFFEPMGEPAHGYCGRQEFPCSSRTTCKDCKYI